MAVYELVYQRIPGQRQRPAAPSVAIALADLRVLRGRKAIRHAVSGMTLFTLAVSGYAVLRSGILKDYLPFLPAGVLAPVDRSFFETAFTSSFYHLMLTLLALFAGAGRIAEDLRSHALALYLAKPLTRGDYLAGKIGATAAVVALGALGSPLVAWLVAGLVDPAFLAQNLRLGAAIVALGLVTTAYYTSAVLFFSSIARSGRIAGLLFGCLVFLSNGVREASGAALRTTATSVLGFRSNLTTLASHLFGTARMTTPALDSALLAIGIVIVVGLWTAWRRVRAVEVVT